ncbi:brassinosteroid LRR receptor kinase-like [Cryptomeria japonica]|uniref:brassinosteroid LRR receptor kinase-like n=1 Tax=Cryptomeria japonica TaxID=3369 RepID=UPI0025AC45CD|nr:brassinosteroid LRR receptor kinase-like [Cryptomeria japonica]
MNSLGGRIPLEIAQCVLLEDLELCCNNNSGTIPSQIANLRNLNTFLDLHCNALTGPVLAGIRGMQMIQAVDLSVNKLIGAVPTQIIGLVGLKYLNLSYNHLEGILPSVIWQKLSILEELDLSHNNITGSVPPSISKLEMLEILELGYNNFIGQVPYTGAVKKMNMTSFLENPRLCEIAGSLRISMEELKRATRDYNCDNLIDAGNYRSVYRGVLLSGESVAIKAFRVSDSERVERSFIRECKTLGKVRHQNLGLRYLHHDCSPQIVHCDLKLQNVLLDEDMMTDVADFGIAWLFGPTDDSANTTSALKGTVGYIPPS